MKKKIIILCIVGIAGCAQGAAKGADTIVGEYSGDQTAGFEEILEGSEDFDLGINEYEQPIFVDRNKAYKRMLSTCKDGIIAVREKADLPPLEKNKDSLAAYGSVGAELSETEYDKGILKQAAFLGAFYDIYCHSDDDFYE